MSEAVDQFVAVIGDAIGKRAAEKFAAEIRAKLMLPPPDPILSYGAAGKRLGVSARSVGRLVEQGLLARVPGFIDGRVKQSECDAYGTKGVK